MIPWFAEDPADIPENTCVSFVPKVRITHCQCAFIFYIFNIYRLKNVGRPPVVEDLTSTDFCCRSDVTDGWMVPLAVDVAVWIVA